MSLAELASVVGGFSTGLAVLVALPVAYFQVREQRRFAALALFADHFGKIPELLISLAGRIQSLTSTSSTRQWDEESVRVYDEVVRLQHHVMIIASVSTYASELVSKSDIEYVRHELLAARYAVEQASSHLQSLPREDRVHRSHILITLGSSFDICEARISTILGRIQ